MAGSTKLCFGFDAGGGTWTGGALGRTYWEAGGGAVGGIEGGNLGALVGGGNEGDGAVCGGGGGSEGWTEMSAMWAPATV